MEIVEGLEVGLFVDWIFVDDDVDDGIGEVLLPGVAVVDGSAGLEPHVAAVFLATLAQLSHWKHFNSAEAKNISFRKS